MWPGTLTLIASIIPVAYGAISPLRRHVAFNKHNPSPITATLNSHWFDVEVQFGNQTFMLVVDTGSSDTWVAQTGYTCIDPKSNLQVPPEECGWAPTYDVAPSLKFATNQTFGVQYGTGIALGQVGFEDVTLGGITVRGQKVGIVDRTNDKGDAINSGILGLGFPMLTSAHPGNDISNDSIKLITQRAVYDPLFVSMYKKGLVEPWYSIAIERLPRNTSTGPGGWLGLGELPPVQHAEKWTVAPIEITEGIPDMIYPQGTPEISLMTLSVDSVSWGPTASIVTNATKFQAVVDSGNPRNQFPREISRSINNQFRPPAVFNAELGVYTVDCGAKAPELGVTIGGDTFWHNAEDLIARDHSSGICFSTVADSAEGLGIAINFLGDAFMKNVVSVFDFEKKEMRFARRDGNGKPGSTSKPGESKDGKPGPTISAVPESNANRLVRDCLLFRILFVGIAAGQWLL